MPRRHGSPYTLLAGAGTFSGHIDLAELGVADRWLDIADATMSANCNYGPGWEQAVLDAYDVEDDPVGSDYYRRLWNLGP